MTPLEHQIARLRVVPKSATDAQLPDDLGRGHAGGVADGIESDRIHIYVGRASRLMNLTNPGPVSPPT
jgi:hypothetical protein